MQEFIEYPKFIKNKYHNWYISLIMKNINKYSENKNTEKHHILPKSFNGSDSSNNIVVLPYREHYIAHQLLTKFTSNKDKMKMCYAMHCFFHFNEERKIILNINNSSKLYQYCREETTQYLKNNPRYKTEKFLIKHKESERMFYGTRNEIIKNTDLDQQDIYHLISRRCRYAKKWGIFYEEINIFSLEIPRKQSSNLTWKVCPHCNQNIDNRNYKRWHGDNCKTINPESYKKNYDICVKNITEYRKKEIISF